MTLGCVATGRRNIWGNDLGWFVYGCCRSVAAFFPPSRKLLFTRGQVLRQRASSTVDFDDQWSWIYLLRAVPGSLLMLLQLLPLLLEGRAFAVGLTTASVRCLSHAVDRCRWNHHFPFRCLTRPRLGYDVWTMSESSCMHKMTFWQTTLLCSAVLLLMNV